MKKSRELNTLVDVLVSSEQVKAVIRVQQNTSNDVKERVTFDRMISSINELVEMYKGGKLSIADGKLVPLGFGYRASSELNNIEDSIMNNIHKVNMPDSWA